MRKKTCKGLPEHHQGQKLFDAGQDQLVMFPIYFRIIWQEHKEANSHEGMRKFVSIRVDGTTARIV
jgi:hypothetical protein